MTSHEALSQMSGIQYLKANFFFLPERNIFYRPIGVRHDHFVFMHHTMDADKTIISPIFK